MFVRLLAPLLLTLAVARAAYPDFTGTKPNGGQRGAEVKVTLTGTRLADFEDLLFYTPGFRVKPGVKKGSDILRGRAGHLLEAAMGSAQAAGWTVRVDT